MAETPTTPASTPAKKASPPAATPARLATPNGDQTVTGRSPADQAVADAVRKAEKERLIEERDALREKLGEAPELDLLRAEVDALRQVAARSGVSLGRNRMSAGVASDLEVNGVAVDPANGDVYIADGGKVTLTTRAGEVREVDMPGRSTDKPTK